MAAGCSAVDSDGGVTETRNTSDPTKESYSPLAAGETQAKSEKSAHDGASDGESPGVVTSALTAAGTYDVGVISNGSCPNPVTIYMDDEDSSNNSSLSGWVGATSSQTRFQFCRVDGSAFNNISSWCATSRANSYAVLKLGTTCPNGSVEFSRYFDNEDSGNNNSNSGNIAPSTQSSSGTRLTFCGFLQDNLNGDRCAWPTSPLDLKNFPILGFAYGVFAGSSVALAFESGQIYTDDEDSGNANNWDLSKLNSWQVSAVQSFMSGGSNTQLGTARVGDQCNGTPGTWAGCAGNGCFVCAEKMTDYPFYFNHHRHCQKNTTCVGSYYTCNADCPAPTDADKTF